MTWPPVAGPGTTHACSRSGCTASTVPRIAKETLGILEKPGPVFLGRPLYCVVRLRLAESSVFTVDGHVLRTNQAEMVSWSERRASGGEFVSLTVLDQEMRA